MKLFYGCLLLLTLQVNAADWEKINSQGQGIAPDAGPWSCVRQGQLLWEVKGLTDNLLHYKNTFSWFWLQQGHPLGGSCADVAAYQRCDSQQLIDALNQQRRCGHNNWRLPTVAELTALLQPPSQPGMPLIDSYLFPRTIKGPYWSQDQEQGQRFVVHFGDGSVYPLPAKRVAWLRLVADWQP